MTQSSAIFSAAVAVTLGATAFAGATVHLPALLLRSLVVITCVLVWPSGTGVLRHRDLIAPGLALLVLLFNLPFAVQVGPGLQAAIQVILVVILYLSLLISRRDVSGSALWVATLVGLVHALWASYQWLVVGEPRGRGGFFNPNDLAALLAPLLVLAAWRLIGGLPSPDTPLSPSTPLSPDTPAKPDTLPDSSHRKILSVLAHHPLAHLLVALILGSGLVATGSRSGLLAAVAGCLILSVARARRTTLFALAAVMVLSVVVIATPSLRGRFTGEGDALAYGRLAIWRQSLAVAVASPAGVGLGGYEAAMRKRGVPVLGWVRYPKQAQNAHSEPLDAWVELGVLGLLATCVPPLLLLASLWRRQRAGASGSSNRQADHQHTSEPPIVGLAVLSAFVLPACVSASLHVPPIAFLAAVWAARIVRHDPGGGRIVHVPAIRALVLAVLLMVLLAALPGAIGNWSLERSAQARDRGNLALAIERAHLAELSMPFSLAARMMTLSLEHARGDPRAAVLEKLIQLADAHPHALEPVIRAAQLLDAAARSGDPQIARLAGAMRAEQARRDPHNALAWLALARAQLRTDNQQAARRALERALQEEPHCAGALAHLAGLEHGAHREELAVELVRRAQKSHEQSSRYQGYARQVLSLDPNSASILATLGARQP